MMIFCCMPPEKFSIDASAKRSSGMPRSRIRTFAPRFALLVAEPETAMRAEMGQQEVLLDRQVGNDVLRSAILGDKAQARPDRSLRTVGLERLSAERHLSGGARPQAEDGFHGLGPSGPDKPTEAHDLAFMSRKRHVAHDGQGREIADIQSDRCCSTEVYGTRRRIDCAEIGSHHGADDFGPDRGSPSPARASWSGPRASTVTRSVMAKTSSRRCDTKTRPHPVRRNRLMTSKRRSVSPGERDAVGSSKMMSFARTPNALAISTSCFCCRWTARGPPGRVAGRRLVRGSTGSPGPAP